MTKVTEGSVTCSIQQLQDGNRDGTEQLWNHFYSRLPLHYCTDCPASVTVTLRRDEPRSADLTHDVAQSSGTSG